MHRLGRKDLRCGSKGCVAGRRNLIRRSQRGDSAVRTRKGELGDPLMVHFVSLQRWAGEEAVDETIEKA